jgi:hypothetical protein
VSRSYPAAPVLAVALVPVLLATGCTARVSSSDVTRGLAGVSGVVTASTSCVVDERCDATVTLAEDADAETFADVVDALEETVAGDLDVIEVVRPGDRRMALHVSRPRQSADEAVAAIGAADAFDPVARMDVYVGGPHPGVRMGVDPGTPLRVVTGVLDDVLRAGRPPNFHVTVGEIQIEGADGVDVSQELALAVGLDAAYGIESGFVDDGRVAVRLPVGTDLVAARTFATQQPGYASVPVVDLGDGELLAAAAVTAAAPVIRRVIGADPGLVAHDTGGTAVVLTARTLADAERLDGILRRRAPGKYAGVEVEWRVGEQVSLRRFAGGELWFAAAGQVLERGIGERVQQDPEGALLVWLHPGADLRAAAAALAQTELRHESRTVLLHWDDAGTSRSVTFESGDREVDAYADTTAVPAGQLAAIRTGWREGWAE